VKIDQSRIGPPNQYSGSYSCQLTDGNVGIWQTLTGLKPNTTYTFTAWIKPSSASDYAYVFVKNYAGTSPQIIGPLVNVVTGGYSFTALHFTTDGAGTATIGVWKDGGSGSAWIDDLTLM
jgi:hypothetical protein